VEVSEAMNLNSRSAYAVTLLSLLAACADQRASQNTEPALNSAPINARTYDYEAVAAVWRKCATRGHDGVAYSTADLLALGSDPVTVKQLLQNVRLIWEKDLLLEPAFYDPEVLQHFFGEDKLSGPTSPPLPIGGMQPLITKMTIRALRDSAVTLDASCSESPVPTRRLNVGTYARMTIDVRGDADVRLAAVRDAFGREQENTVDSGLTTDGRIVDPQFLGSVAYRRPGEARGSIMGAVFLFKRAVIDQSKEPRSKILEDDVLQRIDVAQSRTRSVEN
jgi:hypothetical protein